MCVLYIGAEELAIVLKLMDRCVECALHVSSGTGGAERKAIFVGGDDSEAVAFQFLLYGLNLRLRWRELLQIVVGEPMMMVGEPGS
jgi:hypothetical protein